MLRAEERLRERREKKLRVNPPWNVVPGLVTLKLRLQHRFRGWHAKVFRVGGGEISKMLKADALKYRILLNNVM